MATVLINYNLDRYQNSQRILDIFSLISQSSSEKSKSEKVKAIQEILKDNKIESYYLENAGLIVPARKRRNLVIMSHYDLIPSFEKKFRDKNNVVAKLTEKGNLKGALDNTITNAVIIDIIINNPEILDYTEIVFTEEEEVGCIGSKNYMKFMNQSYKNFNENTFIINLDVTNEGYAEDKSISLEYDEPHWNICKRIDNIVKNQGHWTKDRVTDDLDSVLSNGGNGISICLPTKGIIHSFKNSTKIEFLENYRNLLKDIIVSFSSGEKIELKGAFEYLEIEEALKIKDEKELKEKESEEEEKNKNRYSSYNSYLWAFENYDEEEEEYNFKNFIPDYKSYKNYKNYKDFIESSFVKSIKTVIEEDISYVGDEDHIPLIDHIEMYKDMFINVISRLLEDVPYGDKSLEFIAEIKKEIIKMLDGVGNYFKVIPNNLSSNEKRFLQAALNKGILVNVAEEVGEWEISIPHDDEFFRFIILDCSQYFY